MTITINSAVTYVPVVCGVCGCQFALEQNHYRILKDEKHTWHCPNGHERCFGESEADRPRKEMNRLAAQLANKNQLVASLREAVEQEQVEKARVERRLTATKGVVTRLKHKAAKGECPCCSQTFADLETHMREQHPEYAQTEEPEEGATE